MPAAAIPIIMAATTVASTGYSIYSANKQQNALQDQYNQQRQTSEGILNDQSDLSKKVVGTAMPGIRQAQGYYSTLLGGDRGQMRLATAGQRTATNDTYRGAERGIRSRLTGGARDTALAEMERDRAGKVSGLTTGVQGDAAKALGDMSGSLLGTGNAALGNAGLTSANLLNASGQNMWKNQEANAGSMKGWGSLLSSLLNQYGGGMGKSGGGGILPSRQLTPSYTGLMPGGSPSGNMGGY